MHCLTALTSELSLSLSEMFASSAEELGLVFFMDSVLDLLRFIFLIQTARTRLN